MNKKAVIGYDVAGMQQELFGQPLKTGVELISVTPETRKVWSTKSLKYKDQTRYWRTFWDNQKRQVFSVLQDREYRAQGVAKQWALWAYKYADVIFKDCPTVAEGINKANPTDFFETWHKVTGQKIPHDYEGKVYTNFTVLQNLCIK